MVRVTTPTILVLLPMLVGNAAWLGAGAVRGQDLPLEPTAAQLSTARAAATQPGVPPAPAAADPQAPPRDGPSTLVEVDRIVTPIKDLVANRVANYFVPQQVAFAPDGKDFAGVGLACAAWRAEGGLLWGKGVNGDRVSYSADGTKIYVTASSGLTVYERKTGNKLTTCQLGLPPKGPDSKPLKPAAPLPQGIEIRPGAVVSPDGKTAFAPTATTTAKNRHSDFGIRAYETLRGKELRKFPSKHTAWVTCLALSPDGKHLLTGSEDFTVRLWEAATGKELRIFKGHSARVVTVGWSGDGKRIVSAADDYDQNLLGQLVAQKKPTDAARKDGTVRVWAVGTGDELFQIKAPPSQNQACLTPDGRFVAVGSSIWAVGKQAPRYVGAAQGSAIAFTPDGRMLLALAPEPLRGLNAPTFALVRYRFPEAAAAPGGAPPKPASEPLLPEITQLAVKVLGDFEKPASDVRVLSDNKRAVSVSGDGMLRLWDLKDGKALKAINVGEPLARLAVRSSTSIAVATFVPINLKAVQPSEYASVFFVNLDSGQKTHAVRDLSPRIRGLALSTDGARLASCGANVQVWAVSGNALRPAIPLPSSDGRPSGGEIESVVFAGKRIITGGGDGLIKAWDPATLRVQALAGHGGAVTALTVSRDGKYLLSGSADHTLILWELTKAQQVRTFSGHGHRVLRVSFLADGKRVASLSDRGEVIVWNFTTGAALRRFQGPDRLLHSAAVSADARFGLFGTADGPLMFAELPAE